MCRIRSLTSALPPFVVCRCFQGSAGKFVEGEQRVAILDQALARPGLMSSANLKCASR